MRILIISLLLCSCGPPPAPHGRYQGDLTDHEGRQHECRVEIIPTSLDRVHIHLDYGDQCDGDGAFVIGDSLLPDAGGEIIAQGSPEDITKIKNSYTGQFLKEKLDLPKSRVKKRA